MACNNNNPPKQEPKQQPKDLSNTPQLNRAGFPRQKASKACTKCRQRKVRCQPSPNSDGPCANCTKNKANCVWPEARAPKVPQKLMLETLEIRLNIMYKELESLRQIKTDEELDDEEFASNSMLYSDIPLEGDFNLTMDSVDTCIFNGGEIMPSDYVDNPDEYLNLFAPYANNFNTSERNNSSVSSYVSPPSNDLQPNHRFGSTVPESFGMNNSKIATMMNNFSLPSATSYNEYLITEDPRLAPEAPLPSLIEIRGPQDLPPPETIEHLVELYIEHVHIYFPIFHKPSLLCRIKNLSGMSRCLLNAIFANAAGFSPRQSLQGRGSDFYTRAMALLDDYQDQARLSTVQAALLIFKYQEREGFSWRMHSNFGFIAQSIKELGLDQRSEGIWEGDEWEEEERRRVYWTCLMVDRMYCGIHDRPFNLKEGNNNLPDTLPLEDLIEEAQSVGYARSLIKISVIIGRILEFNRRMARYNRQNTKGNSKNSQKSAELSIQRASHQLTYFLDIWLSNIKITHSFVYPPSDHRDKYPTERQPTPPHIGLLHVLYHTAVILLYKPRMTDSYDTLMMCSAAASHITGIFETLNQDYPNCFHNPIHGINTSIFCLTQARNVHKYNTEFLDPKSALPALGEFEKTLDLLGKLGAMTTQPSQHLGIRKRDNEEDMMIYGRERSVSLALSSSSSTTARSTSPPSSSSSISSSSSPSISTAPSFSPSANVLLTPNQSIIDDTSVTPFFTSIPQKPFKICTGQERPTRKRRLDTDDKSISYSNQEFTIPSATTAQYNIFLSTPPHQSYTNLALASVCCAPAYRHPDTILESSLYPGFITTGETLYQQPAEFY